MSKIKVVVVDDALVIRKIVTDVLQSDPGIEVIGQGANGRQGLERIERLQPDVVTLDIEMPEMDGIQAMREIRRRWPRLPVVMFSTLTERGAAATIEALSAGASDYVTKPANVGSAQAAFEAVRHELIPKIKALAVRGTDRPERARPAAPGATPTGTSASTSPSRVAAVSDTVKLAQKHSYSNPDVLVIGSSTGGPKALEDVLGTLRADFPVPILLVQHMPEVFTRLLAESLDRKCALNVVEVTGPMDARPGTVYVAPGDRHLVVAKAAGAYASLDLNTWPAENSCRPAVDVLFRSVAEVYGGRAMGLILTGMGQDGLEGTRTMHRAGAEIIAQDEATSVVWGMPGFVARDGICSTVLPLEGIGPHLQTRFDRIRGARSTAGAAR